jgi:hypothetical protein
MYLFRHIYYNEQQCIQIVVFWVVKPCILVCGSQHFGKHTASIFSVESKTVDLCPEDGCDTFLRNVGNHLHDYTVASRKTTSNIFTSLEISDLIELTRSNLIHIVLDGISATVTEQ